MGTRSTVKFYAGTREDPFAQEGCICAVYQQHDGYPSGVGAVLAEFLSKRKLVNGFGMNMEAPAFANGPGCLAAQYIADNKKGIGGLYMTPLDDRQQYNYAVAVCTGESGGYVVVRVTDDDGAILFDGGVSEFAAYCDGCED